MRRSTKLRSHGKSPLRGESRFFVGFAEAAARHRMTVDT